MEKHRQRDNRSGRAKAIPVSVSAAFAPYADASPLRIAGDSTGGGMAAAKWQFSRSVSVPGNLEMHVLCYLVAGTPPVTKVARGHRTRKRPRLGSVTFVPGDCRTEWLFSGPVEVVHVYLDPRAVREFAEQQLGLAAVPAIQDFFAVEDPWLGGYFQMLISEYEMSAQSGHPVDSLLLAQTRHLLIRHLVRHYSDAGAGTYAEADRSSGVNPLRPVVVQRVQEYIDANVGEAISLDVLAGLAHMSVDHFLRSFRVAVGTTPYRYVLDQRLRMAAKMVSDGDAPIAVVATEGGFRNADYFSVKFRARFGVSPSQYRRLHSRIV